MTVRVAIVGGGFAGLFTASQLVAAGVDDIVVLEASSHPGGVARTVTRGDFLLEPGAGSFILPHMHLSKVLSEANAAVLPAEVTARRRYVWTGERLVTLPAGPAALLAPIAPARAKLRAAMEPFVAELPVDEGESLDQFLRRRFGDEVGRTAAWLAASGVYAGDPTSLSARAAFPALAAVDGSIIGGAVARIRSRPRRAPRPTTHVPVVSMAALADALASSLGERYRTGSRVEAVRRSSTGWQVHGSERIDAAAVVIACPPDVAAGLVEDPLRRALGGSTAAPVVVVGLGGPESRMPVPAGFGILTGPDAGTVTRGVLLESSYAPHRAPPGHALVKVIAGGAPHRRVIDEVDDDALVEVVGSELARILGSDIDASFAQVVRDPRGIPQYEVGHGEWLAGVDEATPLAMHLTGWGYRGVGLAHLAADAVRITDTIAP